MPSIPTRWAAALSAGLAAPNVLNLLAFAGVITFDGFFLGRIGSNALAGASETGVLRLRGLILPGTRFRRRQWLWALLRPLSTRL